MIVDIHKIVFLAFLAAVSDALWFWDDAQAWIIALAREMET